MSGVGAGEGGRKLSFSANASQVLRTTAGALKGAVRFDGRPGYREARPPFSQLCLPSSLALRDLRIQLENSTPNELTISIDNATLADEGEYTCSIFTMPVRTAKAIVTVLGEARAGKDTFCPCLAFPAGTFPGCAIAAVHKGQFACQEGRLIASLPAG